MPTPESIQSERHRRFLPTKGSDYGVQRDVRAHAAFAAHDLSLFDAVEVLERARSIKSPEEVLCMNVAIGVAEVGMARMREALRPGMTEASLWSILHQTNISMGGEWIDCRLLAEGDRAVPWMQETSLRMFEEALLE